MQPWQILLGFARRAVQVRVGVRVSFYFLLVQLVAVYGLLV